MNYRIIPNGLFNKTEWKEEPSSEIRLNMGVLEQLAQENMPSYIPSQISFERDISLQDIETAIREVLEERGDREFAVTFDTPWHIETEYLTREEVVNRYPTESVRLDIIDHGIFGEVSTPLESEQIQQDLLNNARSVVDRMRPLQVEYNQQLEEQNYLQILDQLSQEENDV